MKILNAFSENIINQNIQRFGQNIEFKRPILNGYKEVTDEFEITVIQRCVYHVASDYGIVNANQTDAGKTSNGKREMLLTNYNPNIKVEDYCNVNDKFYRVYYIDNYQQSDKFIDILLEEVHHESNREFGKNEK